MSGPGDALFTEPDTSTGLSLGFRVAARLLTHGRPTIMSDAHCPSCGMLIPTGPHRDSSQCIQALEEELRRLQELLSVVRLSEKKPVHESKVLVSRAEDFSDR